MFTMLQDLLVACLAVCVTRSLALSDSQYLPWLGYQTVPAYRFPGYHQHYYPHILTDYHQTVLPEVTLQNSPPPPPPPPPAPAPAPAPAPQPVFSPVISPIQEQ